MDTQQRIRDFLREDLKKNMEGISDQQSLLEAGILDSMGVLELVGFLEREFALVIHDDDLMPENFDSIDAVQSFIARSRRADG